MTHTKSTKKPALDAIDCLRDIGSLSDFNHASVMATIDNHFPAEIREPEETCAALLFMTVKLLQATGTLS